MAGRTSLISIAEEVPSNLPDPDALNGADINLPLINEESDKLHSMSGAPMSPWDNPQTPGDHLVNDDITFNEEVAEPKSPTRHSRTPAAHQSPRRSAPVSKSTQTKQIGF